MRIPKAVACFIVALSTAMPAATANAVAGSSEHTTEVAMNVVSAVPNSVSIHGYHQLVEGLKESGAYPVGEDRIGYDVEGYGTIVLQDVPTETSGDVAGPDVWGGGGLANPYVSFNRVDQAAIIAGGGAALVGAICAIPAVGTVACIIAGSIVAAASVYLAAYGRCSEAYPNLRFYVRTRTVTGCYQ